MPSSGKILIIGGGIGGLACALALIRRGIDVEVFEQAHEAARGRRRRFDSLDNAISFLL